jgi:hypothetical protein
MKKFFSFFKKVFFDDLLALFLISSGLIVNIAGWVILGWVIRPFQTGVILHYNVFFGIDEIAIDLENYYFQVFSASSGGLAIWFLNLVLGLILYYQLLEEQDNYPKRTLVNKKQKREKKYYLDYVDGKRLATYLLWGGGSIVQFIILVYVFSVIVVNK